MGDSVQERIEKARAEAEQMKEEIAKNREAKNDTDRKYFCRAKRMYSSC